MCSRSRRELIRALLIFGISCSAIHASGDTSAVAAEAVPPLLYAEKQASAGAVAYSQHCAKCHGPLLDGQAGGYSAPALRGPQFAAPESDVDVKDIFLTVARRMPSIAPRSLPPETYVNIMAFILRENGYPSGPTELTYELASLSEAPMRFYAERTDQE